MIAFVRPSLPLLESVLDRELCIVVLLDIKLGSKLGTILDRGLCTLALDIKLGSKLGTAVLDIDLGKVLDIKLGSKL
jgi:hypothetical protein